MTEEEILQELRTMKTLLAIDKRDELEELTSEFSEIQEHILDPYEWRALSTSEIADDLDTGTTTISNHRVDLVERNLIEKRGQGRGAEYRITGLLGCAEMLGLVDLDE